MQVDEYADADRREVNPPIEVESATWFTGVLVAFARYSRDSSFASLRANKGFVLAMATGSIISTIFGGLLLGAVPEAVLIPLLVALLLASAIKVWRHN